MPHANATTADRIVTGVRVLVLMKQIIPDKVIGSVDTTEINEELSRDNFAEKRYSVNKKMDICNKINSDMLSDTAKKIVR